jgi:hypothetical protein
MARSQATVQQASKFVTATWPNQVWAMDITYIPMARGFVYLRYGWRASQWSAVMALPRLFDHLDRSV